MQRKNLTDAGAATVGTFSLAAWLLPALFNAIGWIQWAQSLNGVFVLFADPRISWPGVYVLLTIGAVMVGIVNNWKVIREWRQRRADAHVRHWNLAATDATNYLATNARLAASLNPGRRHEEAAEALRDAARHGQVAVAGRTPSSGLLVRLTQQDLSRGAWRVRVGDDGYGNSSVREVWLSEKADPRLVLFRGLMVDAKDFGEHFP